MSVLDFTDWIYGCKWLRSFRTGKSQELKSEPEPFYLRTLQITETTMGADHPQVALVLNNLADLYRGQNRCDEAEALYQKALKISEKKLGPEHPQVGLILEGYAHLLLNMKRLREAAEIGKRAIRIRVKHAKEDLDR